MAATVPRERAQEDQLRQVEQRLIRHHRELPPEVVRYEFTRACDVFADGRIGTFVALLVGAGRRAAFRPSHGRRRYLAP